MLRNTSVVSGPARRGGCGISDLQSQSRRVADVAVAVSAVSRLWYLSGDRTLLDSIRDHRTDRLRDDRRAPRQPRGKEERHRE
jgi:hypothetical protein